MHVLIVPSWYKNSRVSANGSFVRDQAVALAEKITKVGVIYNDLYYLEGGIRQRVLPSLSTSRYLDGKIEVFSRETVQIPLVGATFLLNSKINKLNSRRNLQSWKLLFKQYVRSHGMPDLIHAHSFYSRSFLSWLKAEYQLKIVLTEHWSGFGDMKSIGAKRSWISEAYSGCDRIIAVSEGLGHSIKKEFGLDFVYIPNFTNCIFHGDLKSTDNGCFRLGALGYFTERKRFDLMIKSVAMVVENYPNLNVKLDIAGSGPLKDQLVGLVSDLGLGNVVRFVGFVERENLGNFLRGIDCLISTSKYETFGMTLVEAAMAGKPVISVTSDGPESIIIDEHMGILIDSDKKHDISDGIARLATNISSYDANRVRSICTERFSRDVVITQIVALYKELIDF